MENIRRACLEISYANGGVNRFRSEQKALRAMQRFLDSRPYHDEFRAIDAWLGTLNKEQLETVCDGEQSEQEVILADAPAFTATLLNEYFEVC